VPLQQSIEHETVLVYSPPQPVSNAVHRRTHLVERPPGTPTRFPVAQVFSEKGSEFHAPFAERLVTHLNAALVKQLLHVSVAQGKTVIKPDGVLNDGHGKTVAIGLGVGHGASAYPDPIKATQPFALFGGMQFLGMAVSGVLGDQVGVLVINIDAAMYVLAGLLVLTISCALPRNNGLATTAWAEKEPAKL